MSVARRFIVQQWTPTRVSVARLDGDGSPVLDPETGNVLYDLKRVAPTHFQVELHSLSMDGVKVLFGQVSVTLNNADDLTGENYAEIQRILVERNLLSSSAPSPTVGDAAEALEAERAIRWEAVASIRDGLETKGFPYMGHWFDSDERSAARINTSAIAAIAATMMAVEFSTEWTVADNSTVTLTRDQIIGLPVAFVTYGASLHEKARVLRARIAAATTIPEVRMCVWEGVEAVPEIPQVTKPAAGPEVA